MLMLMLMLTYSPTATPLANNYPLATIRSSYYNGCYCVHTSNDNNICVFNLLMTTRTTIKMTADDDSCSLYDSVSATDLTVGKTNSVTDTTTDIDTSSGDPDNAFYQQLQMVHQFFHRYYVPRPTLLFLSTSRIEV